MIARQVKRFIGVFAVACVLLFFFVSFCDDAAPLLNFTWCFRIIKGFGTFIGPWTSLRLTSRNHSNH